MSQIGTANAPPGDRNVIVVLGMHRSGTSLAASLLQALGLDLGPQLIRGDQHNQAGYFEQERIVRLNEQTIRAIDRRWVGPKGSLPYPDGWWELPEVAPLRAELTETVREELQRTKAVWGFKDPRVSRMIPLWREIFADLGVNPLYVLAVRHPGAVVASLSLRDGLSPARSQLLWLEHNLEAVVEAEGALRRVVDYDRWFRDGEGQAKCLAQAVGLPWPIDDSPWQRLLLPLIQSGLRHSAPALEHPLPLVEDTYRLLEDAATSGEVPGELVRHEQVLRQAATLLHAWSELLESAELEMSSAGRAGQSSTSPTLRLRNRLQRMLTG